jgi:phage terminase large subunit-like protein
MATRTELEKIAIQATEYPQHDEPAKTRLRDLTSRTDGSVHITVGKMWENTFLDEGMADDPRREYMGTRLGRQELEGEMLGDFEGALISRDDLDKHRVPRKSIPLLSLVVVGVDPAMKAGEDHDESGIIVAGEGAGPDSELHAYIIDDRSLRGTPNQVMQQVAAAFRKWEGDCAVLETNQGGDFVRDTLRTVDPSIPVRTVHAMKSKVLRAERVSALFEQGKIHMAGTFPELEDELCMLMPGEVPVRSPDRLTRRCSRSSSFAIWARAVPGCRLTTCRTALTARPHWASSGSNVPNAGINASRNPKPRKRQATN